MLAITANNGQEISFLALISRRHYVVQTMALLIIKPKHTCHLLQEYVDMGVTCPLDAEVMS